MKKIVLFVFLLALLGCSDKKKLSQAQDDIHLIDSLRLITIYKASEKETIYLDNNQVWHYSLSCTMLRTSLGGSIGVKRYDPKFIEELGFCCSSCIDDNIYTGLNISVGAYYRNCKELYDKLSNLNYNFASSYSDFAEKMHNEISRRSIYNAAWMEKLIDEDFDEFSEKFGFDLCE